MRHFSHLTDESIDQLFHVAPQSFSIESDRQLVATALGATLYSPSIRTTLNRDITREGLAGLTSMVACLEDSIADHQVPEGEENLVQTVKAQYQTRKELDQQFPMLFTRIRTPDQITDLVERMEDASAVLEGFVLPKFDGTTGEAFMEAIQQASAAAGKQFLAMPILESPELAYWETRNDTLRAAREIIEKYRDSVLAVRLGATDLSGAYGLRRSAEFTVYDIRVVAETISAVVNEFGRYGDGFTITGPVWEYFGHHERLFRPELRASPFAETDNEEIRTELLASDMDGLLKEVSLDQANGLTGKTVIHPSHVRPVHALSVVTLEQWSDAMSTMQKADDGGGVLSSMYRNKMNEAKPHQGWAEKILRRASVFGVAREETTFVDLLAAGV